MRYVKENDQIPADDLFMQGKKVRGEVETGNEIIRQLQEKFDIRIFAELIGTKLFIPQSAGPDNSFVVVGIDPTVDQMTIKPIGGAKEQKIRITELLSKPFTYEKMDNTFEPTE